MEPGVWRDEDPAKAAEAERPVKIVERAFEGKGSEQRACCHTLPKVR